MKIAVVREKAQNILLFIDLILQIHPVDITQIIIFKPVRILQLFYKLLANHDLGFEVAFRVGIDYCIDVNVAHPHQCYCTQIANWQYEEKHQCEQQNYRILFHDTSFHMHVMCMCGTGYFLKNIRPLQEQSPNLAKNSGCWPIATHWRFCCT